MADTTQYSFARYEQKYFLTPQQQAALLERIAPHIRRDVYGRYTICSLYYDTDDWRLIRASLEKPAYKEKLRVRSYGVPTDGGRVFVEIKKKYDGVVYKRRITASPADAAAFLRTGKSTQPLGQIGRAAQKIFLHCPHLPLMSRMAASSCCATCASSCRNSRALMRSTPARSAVSWMSASDVTTRTDSFLPISSASFSM